MNALLLVAHGSRRRESNEEIRALAAKLRELQNSQRAPFALTAHAFLEMAEPTIAAGIAELAAQGARDIAVLPYLLAAGNHVNADIPREIAAAARAHPRITITLAPHFGAADGVAQLIVEHARAHAGE